MVDVFFSNSYSGMQYKEIETLSSSNGSRTFGLPIDNSDALKLRSCRNLAGVSPSRPEMAAV